MADSLDPQQTVTLTSPNGKSADDFENIVFHDDMIDAPVVDGAWTLGEARVDQVDGWDLVPFTEGTESILLPDATERWQHFNRLRQEQAMAEFNTGGLSQSARTQQDAAALAARPRRAVRRAWPRRALMAGLAIVAVAGILYGASLFDSRAEVSLLPAKTAPSSK